MDDCQEPGAKEADGPPGTPIRTGASRPSPGPARQGGPIGSCGPAPLRLLVDLLEVAHHRALACMAYDDCLDVAVRAAWRSWTCRRCAIWRRKAEPGIAFREGRVLTLLPGAPSSGPCRRPAAQSSPARHRAPT